MAEEIENTISTPETVPDMEVVTRYLAFCDILRIFEQNPNGTPQRQIARNGEKPQALPKS